MIVGACDDDAEKGDHWCVSMEHNTYNKKTRLCVDIFLLPVYIKRLFERDGYLTYMHACTHFYMVFMPDSIEGDREKDMRLNCVKYGIGTRVFAEVQLYSAPDKECDDFWHHVAEGVDWRFGTRRGDIMKDIIACPTARVLYEEWAGLALDKVQTLDFNDTHSAISFLNALLFFLAAFKRVFDKSTFLHGGINGSTLLYRHNKMCVVDFEYLCEHTLRRRIAASLGIETVDDAVVLLVKLCEFFGPCSEMAVLQETFSRLWLYPPEVVLFVAFTQDSSDYKQHTFEVCMQRAIKHGFEAEFYIVCFNAFRDTSPCTLGDPALCMMQHVEKYVAFVKSRDPHLYFYIDTHSVKKTVQVCVKNWWRVNHRYFGGNVPQQMRDIEHALQELLPADKRWRTAEQESAVCA